MSEQLSPERPPVRRSRGRAAAIILGVALAGGLVGAFATKAFSQAFGPTWHMTVMGPMRGPFGGLLTPQQIADRADRAVRHLASALGDLVPMREKVFAARQQAHELLTQATIDRGAIEKLRAEQIATMETISKRLVQAVGDAAEVLTPDQRRKLGDMLPPAGGPGGGYWHPWYRG
jgi:protein CpxP